MIHRRSPKEIAKMQSAANLLIETFRLVEKLVEPGVSTIYLDNEIEKFIVKSGGRPAFRGYRGFPASACISIDEVVVHGIPGRQKLDEGQIVGIDMGVELDGYFSDACRTYAIGEIAADKKKLMSVTESAPNRGIEQVQAGNRISDISKAIQSYVEKENFSVVRDLVGHGIGTSLHEEPEVPNFFDDRRGHHPVLMEGMVLAIEPMVNMGVYGVSIMSDGWTVVTQDRKPSAHFEHTVAVSANGPLILTKGR